MKRRDFIKFSASGLTVLAVGSMAGWPRFWRGAQAHASGLLASGVGLAMVEASAEMVDGIEVPMWAFKVVGDDHGEDESHENVAGARIPGPVLVALEGDSVRLQISNHIAQGGAHGFAIPGVSLRHGGSTVSQVTVAHGATEEIEFTAPAAGTYMYLDPLNTPVNRVMGLHGVLVVLPDPIGNNTPYSGLSGSHTVQRLFDDLGTASHFPGNPWDPGRNAVWVFNVIDPVKAEAAASGNGISAATFLNGFLPQYFTLNGKSGFFSAQHGHDLAAGDPHGGFSFGFSDAQANISLHGTVGQPLVIRNLNAGLMWHSPHIHGNHIYPIARANIEGGRAILTNLTMIDTWSLPPGEIVDLLHPFIAPPDIPANFWSRAASGNNDERFPLLYPMHDHNEISNTAAGGNYPHGIASHWQIDGPFDPSDPSTGVIIVDRADLRVKTGQLLLEGRFTVPNVHLAVHAGGAEGPVISEHIQVGSDGRFRYRGRALKALSSRFVTLMHHGEDGAEHAGRTVPLRLR